LPDDAAILPTHGFGSLCSAGSPVGAADTADGASSARREPALLMDEDAFVSRLVAGLDAFPRYLRVYRPRNREGAGKADLDLPPISDARELAGTRRRGPSGLSTCVIAASLPLATLAGTLAFRALGPADHLFSGGCSPGAARSA